MTANEAMNSVISLALNEVGYLEKKSNASLDDKTANAGSSNYTKYWRDIFPQYQGQPWCACFITWLLVKKFGKSVATKMLKHYPYVYVPDMAGLFTNYANPKVGDVVMFKRKGVFTHTGLVVSVDADGDHFYTVEGNTSGGSTIIANGGGVCKKYYSNNNLPGTKFARLDWSIAAASVDNKPTQSANEIAIGTDSNGLTVCVETTLNVRTTPNGETIVKKLNKGDRIGCDKRCWVDGICWFHYNEGWVSGQYIEGWIKENNNWWYVTKGYKYSRNTWQKIGGSWYFFDSNGFRVTGWLTWKEEKYYLDPKTGVMKTGWVKLDNSWYYFKSSGAMVKKCYYEVKGKPYCFMPDGKMVTKVDSNGVVSS